MNNTIFAQLKEFSEKSQAADLITLVSTPAEQAECVGQMLCGVTGKWRGVLVDEPFTQFVVKHLAGEQWKKPAIIELEDTHGHYRLFWDRLSRRRSALVLGGGHISQPLTALLAQIDYAVTVVDDRPDFANVRRFPQAERVICQDFGKALNELSLSSFGAIIVVTRGHRSDLECLQAVINQPAAYVGMIGSQGRVRIIMNSLAQAGVDAEALVRLRAPIGLDIGSETPAEIALSIVAEIVNVNKGGSCRPLSDKWRDK